MADLVACLTDEEGLSHVKSLIEKQQWDNIFLITNSINYNSKFNKKIEFVVVDFTKPVNEVIESIKRELNGKFNDLEVALNIVSGKGKEHMAILSALLKLGIGIRLMAVTKDGVKEL